MNWFPILLVVHIGLAVALLVPSVILPFVLRRTRGEPGGSTRALLAVQDTGSVLIAAGLAVTGAAMLWILGPELLTQPWLLVALVLYALNLAVAAFVSRPGLRRLSVWVRPVRTTPRGVVEHGASATWRTGWRV